MARLVDLIIMRHLPTYGNQQKQYIGWTNQEILDAEVPPLTNQEIQVYSSDLIRCIQTSTLYFPRSTVHTDASFRELHFGDWEEKTYADLQFDTAYRNWIDRPLESTPPKGESFSEFETRVHQALFNLLDTSDSPLILVVHGGVIRLIKSWFTLTPFQQAAAGHNTVFHFTLEKKESWSCISYSEVPTTASEPLFARILKETM